MKTGNTRYHLSTLLVVAFAAGVLMWINFSKHAFWHLDYGPAGMNLPRRPAPDEFHSHPARGLGWPFLVTGTSLPDPGPEQVIWSWMGICGNVVFSICLLFLLVVALEALPGGLRRMAVAKVRA
jgi:hypothetical protein